MSKQTEIIAKGEAHVMKTYNRYPLVFDRGDGVYLWDADGNKYLDFVAGIAVNSLGSNHPKLVRTIARQAGLLLHCSNLYYNEPQVNLAAALTEHSPFDRVFFCNSGAEANEAALKLCRKYAAMTGKKGRKIITAEHSFHGRTYGAVTATGQAKYQKGLDPLLPDFAYVPYNDVAALEAAVDEDTCGVLLEVIQGEGGVHPAKVEYLQKARELCDKVGALLVFDEVQTGVGRTGTLFAFQGWGVTPDAATLAKGLAGGVPIGALLATQKAAEAFQPGDHASTFGGNPLATAAGCGVLEELFDGGLLENVQIVGEQLRQGLLALQQEFPVILEVRGKGLMQGMELSIPAAQVVKGAMERGLLLVGAGDKVVRFVPPLVLTAEQTDEGLAILRDALKMV